METRIEFRIYYEFTSNYNPDVHNPVPGFSCNTKLTIMFYLNYVNTSSSNRLNPIIKQFGNIPASMNNGQYGSKSGEGILTFNTNAGSPSITATDTLYIQKGSSLGGFTNSLYNGQLGNSSFDWFPKLDTSGAGKTMSNMCSLNFNFNQNLNGFTLSTQLENVTSIFNKCLNWNNGHDPGVPNILTWDFSRMVYNGNLNMLFRNANKMNVRILTPISFPREPRSMFIECSNWNNGYAHNVTSNVSGWDFTETYYVSNLFNNCTKFNADLSELQFPNVNDFTNFIQNCTSIDCDIGKAIKTAGNRDDIRIGNMINGSNLSVDNYSKFIIAIYEMYTDLSNDKLLFFKRNTNHRKWDIDQYYNSSAVTAHDYLTNANGNFPDPSYAFTITDLGEQTSLISDTITKKILPEIIEIKEYCNLIPEEETLDNKSYTFYAWKVDTLNEILVKLSERGFKILDSSVGIPNLEILTSENGSWNGTNIIEKINNIFMDITNIGLNRLDLIIFAGSNKYSLYRIDLITNNNVVKLKLLLTSNTIPIQNYEIGDIESEYGSGDSNGETLFGNIDVCYITMYLGCGNAYLILENEI